MGDMATKEEQKIHTQNSFTRFSKWIASKAGNPWAFILAFVMVVLWGVTGPAFDYSDTWQLVINTGTTIITFLMVFLIQNTQNRDTMALQLKLDELLRAVDGAQDALMDLEELNEQELQAVHKHYVDLARAAQKNLRKVESDSANPDA